MTPLRAAVTFALDADGVGWITFDDPEVRANIFNEATQAAFATALDVASRESPRAVVVASAKEKIFIAGANLKELAALPTARAAAEFSRTGQKLFHRLDNFRVPVVAAIHGACAGGGFELVLACHWRIASDAAATQIGLPETSLGTIPGWGGCVRLPQLIGAQPALEHIMRGQLMSVAAALRAGLVDEVVPVAELRARAKAAALRLAAVGAPARNVWSEPEGKFFADLREATRARTQGHQPALLAVIDVVEQTLPLPQDEALEVEAHAFGEVTAGEVCKNLLHVYFLREAAKKRTLDGWFVRSTGKPAPIQRVGVVGAGVMGAGVAQWAAVHGCEVVLRDVQPEIVARGLSAIRGLCDEAVKRGKLSAADAGTALARIATTTGWDGFERCDLVVEAIVEDVAAKRKVFGEIAAVARADALLVSNTSALPIEEIAGHVPNPARMLGLHFFNPVGRMPLVELIIGRETSAETAARALAFVKSLGKSPIVCRSSPGFVVTRVLFFYLNAAVRLWERGVRTERIDAAMRAWGWPMGPLRLIDEVGVDVTDFIFDEMAHYFPARFASAATCRRMVAAGLRGRKTGAGFYLYGAGREAVNRGATGFRRGQSVPLDASAIQAELMHVMVSEADAVLAEGVVQSPDDVDFALLSGAGFPAWRGGLLRHASATAPAHEFVD